LAVIKSSEMNETLLRNKISPFTEEAPQEKFIANTVFQNKAAHAAVTRPLTAEVN
jgi:hypothetical protein